MMAEDNDRTSPAHRVARIGADVVEEILLAVKTLPGRVNRTAIVRDLELAVECLHRVQRSAVRDAQHLDVLAEAHGQVRTARETIEGHDHSERSLKMAARLRGVERTLEKAREATIDRVVTLQDTHLKDELNARSRERVPEPQPFAASHGVPRLHNLKRELVRAHVDATPEEFIWAPEEDRAEEDENVEEEDYDEALDLAPTVLEEEDVERGYGADDPAKRLPLLVPNDNETVATMTPGLEGELAHVERLLRTCLEDIGAMGNLRRTRDHELFDWEGMARFENQLCACLDAAVALGQPFFSAVGPKSRYEGLDVLDHAVRYSRDAITADPGRAFARTMLLASVAGEDTARAALLALKESPPYTYRAQEEAFALGPNPHIRDAMVRLSADDDPRLATLGLNVLTMRNEVDFGTVTPLCEHPSEEVRVSAIRALGVAKERTAAAELLVGLCETEIDDDVWVTGVESLVRLRHPEGPALLRERLVEEVEEPDADMLRADLRTRCMLLIGIAGKADDYLLLERLYFGDTGQAAALAFHGHVRLVDRLILALEGTRADAGVLLGPSGRREAAHALVRITGAPLIRSNDEDRDNPYRLETEASKWMAWWDEHRGEFDPDTRYRFGQPFSPLHTVNELSAPGVPVKTRRECASELEVFMGEPFPIHELVARQRRALARARASIEAAAAGGDPRFSAGRWPLLGA